VVADLSHRDKADSPRPVRPTPQPQQSTQPRSDAAHILDLQRQAGNRAVADRIQSISVQRGDEKTPKQRAQEAADARSPEAIAALDRDAINAATPEQRLAMIDVLNSSGTQFQRIQLPYLWDAFGDQLRATAEANGDRWKKSFTVAASLMRSNYNVVQSRTMFVRDVVHVANDYLDVNEQYCKSEFGRFGLTESGDIPIGPPTADQAHALESTRNDAAKLAADQEAMADLRNVVVGYTNIESPPGGTGAPVYVGQQARFDPDNAPGAGPQPDDLAKGMKTWEEVKKQYDALDRLIRARLMVNPTLFPLARGTPEDASKTKAVAAGSQTDALKTIGDGLKGVLDNIGKARPMLSVLAPDLEPIHGQLIAGTRTGSPDRNWKTSAFYSAIAADMVEERKPGPWWEALGLAAAELGAYVVAGLATGGTALAIGLAAKGAMNTALAAGKADAMQSAYGATTTEEMSLITEGQVNAAQAELIETAAFALIDTVFAAGAVRGALREVLHFEKAAAEGATRAATAANKWMAKEAAKEATAEAKSALPALQAEAANAQKALEDARSAAQSATPEESARAAAAVKRAEEASEKARGLLQATQEAAEGKRVARAAPVVDPNGLGSKASYDATVKAARKEIGSAWKTMTSAEREAKVVKIVQDRMAAQGIPDFAAVIHTPGKGGAAADWVTWSLHIDPALLDGLHSMEDVVSLVYHEAVHFEDFINVARLKLGENLTPSQVQQLLGIDQRGLTAAVNRGKLLPAAAEYTRAKAVFESIWGVNKGARDAIYRTMTLTKLDFELEQLRFNSVVDQQTGQLRPGKTTADLQTAQQYYQQKAAAHSASIRAYEQLPEEVQAYGAQEALLQSFERADFRRKLNMAIAAVVAAGLSAAGLSQLAEEK
jgi:hypothetical protein